jgi:glycine betaine/proline transport system substrate-binding protein
MAEQSQPFLSKRSIVDLGSHSAKAIEDWWYPNYVATWCPGLPDWQALNNCSALFAQDSNPKGTYYTGPWVYRDPDLIRSLDLNFTIVRLADDQSLWEKLDAASAAKKPIIMLNWSPNWTDVRVPGQFVKFPVYNDDCEAVASWGVNPNQLYDCGNKRDAWIKKFAWSGLKKKHPCVQSFIQQISLTNEMIAEAAALVDYDKLTEEKSVERWLAKYALEIAQWSDTPCIGAAQ